MINTTKWMLGCGLPHLGSEFRDRRWTVSASGWEAADVRVRRPLDEPSRLAGPLPARPAG